MNRPAYMEGYMVKRAVKAPDFKKLRGMIGKKITPDLLADIIAASYTYNKKTEGMHKEALRAPTIKNLEPLVTKMTPRMMLNLPAALVGLKDSVKINNSFDKIYTALSNLKKFGKWKRLPI